MKEITENSLMASLQTMMEHELGTSLSPESFSYFFKKRREEALSNTELSLSDTSPDNPLTYAQIKAHESEQLEFLNELEQQFTDWNERRNPVSIMVNDMTDRECSPRTISFYRSIALSFMRMFNYKPLFTTDEIREFLAQYKNNPGSTRKVYRAVLKLLWEVQGMVFPLKQRRIHTPHEAKGKLVPTFSPKEVMRMIKTVKERGTEEDKYYICMATIFAPRRIELAEITSANFSWSGDTGTLTFYPHKHGLLRTHTIPKELTPYLKEYSLKIRNINPSALTRKFNRISSRLGLNIPKTSHKEIKRLRAKRLRPRQYGWHAFRHALTTALLENGVSDTMVNKWMGWRSGSSATPMVGNYYNPVDLDNKVISKHPFIKIWASK